MLERKNYAINLLLRIDRPRSNKTTVTSECVWVCAIERERERKERMKKEEEKVRKDTVKAPLMFFRINTRAKVYFSVKKGL